METWRCLVKAQLKFGAQIHISKNTRSRRKKRKKVAAAVVIAQATKTIIRKTLLSGAESATACSKDLNLISANRLSVETVSLTLSCKVTETL
jgi:acetylglutamate kinase